MNLANKGNSALLAAKNDVRGVVLNFIRTFQFPNPRTKDSFEKAVADGIQLAPLREIIKLLFLFGQMQKEEAYLTSDEVLSFIFYNDNLAKNTSPDRVSVIREILEYRKSGLLGSNIASANQREWNHESRQIGELIKVLEWSKFIDIDLNKIYLKLVAVTI